MRARTVLVTGGCGYIGSHVALRLAQLGLEVVVVDDLSTGFEDALLSGETLYIGSVGDGALLDRIFTRHSIDAVMHFAASAVVPESVADPLKYYGNNTACTLALLRAVVQHGVRHLIFSSTSAVYGQATGGAVGEGHATRPESPYGASKLMCERMLKDVAAATGVRYVILRYFNVAGADPLGRLGPRSRVATQIVTAAVQAAVGLRPGVVIHGKDYPTRDGTCVRDFVHVDDLATAHIQALRYLEGGGSDQLLNVGYGRGSSVLEVVQAVQTASGVDFPVWFGPRRAGDVAEVVAAADRIKGVLDWRPCHDSLPVMVAHALEWKRSQQAQLNGAQA